MNGSSTTRPSMVVQTIVVGVAVLLVAMLFSTTILSQNGAPSAAVVGPVITSRMGEGGFAYYKGPPTSPLYKTLFPSGGTTSFASSVPATNIANGDDRFWINPHLNELYYPTTQPMGLGADIEAFDSTTLQSKGLLPPLPFGSMTGAVDPLGLLLAVSTSSGSMDTQTLFVYYLDPAQILFSQPLGVADFSSPVAFSSDSTTVAVLESLNDQVFRAFDSLTGNPLASIPNQSNQTRGLAVTKNGFWYTQEVHSTQGINSILRYAKVKPVVSVTDFVIPSGSTISVVNSPDFKWVGVNKNDNVIIADETGVKCTIPMGSLINRLQFGKSNTLYVSLYDSTGLAFHSINPTTCTTQLIFDPLTTPSSAPIGFVTPDETYLTWYKGSEFRWYNISTGKSKLITLPVFPTSAPIVGQDT